MRISQPSTVGPSKIRSMAHPPPSRPAPEDLQAFGPALRWRPSSPRSQRARKRVGGGGGSAERLLWLLLVHYLNSGVKAQNGAYVHRTLHPKTRESLTSSQNGQKKLEKHGRFNPKWPQPSQTRLIRHFLRPWVLAWPSDKQNTIPLFSYSHLKQLTGKQHPPSRLKCGPPEPRDPRHVRPLEKTARPSGGILPAAGGEGPGDVGQVLGLELTAAAQDLPIAAPNSF